MASDAAKMLLRALNEKKMYEDALLSLKEDIAALSAEMAANGEWSVGDYEIYDTSKAPLDTSRLRTEYPNLYQAVTDRLRDTYQPDISKADLRRYLSEVEHRPGREIDQLIEGVCEHPDPAQRTYNARRRRA